jgi:hypothetical protein
LDTYKGQFDFTNFTTQTHDFDPGFGKPVNAQGDRLFWTAAIPDSAVEVNLEKGTAEMHVRNLHIEDYFNFPNASADGHEVSATVSFDVVWSGPVRERVNVRDASNGFAGSYVENQATVKWSGSEEGFRFDAKPGSFSTSVTEAGPFAEIGRERNGIFFPGDGGGGGDGEHGVGGQGRPAPAATQTASLSSLSALPAATALDGAGLARALSDSGPAATSPTSLPDQGAGALAATPGSKEQLVPSAWAPHRHVARAALPQVVDQVFAGVDASTLSAGLQADEVPAWVL